MSRPHEMSFAEFAEAVRPSGAINRFPSIGVGNDVFSYSVYMNGALVKDLPPSVREHEFKDVMLHALTEKLDLDSTSARDNLKVAELVALRSTWMLAVLEASVGVEGDFTSQVASDYDVLTNGLAHPWIISQLDQQRGMASKLKPMLQEAGLALGMEVTDTVPKEVSVGKVIDQNDLFTVQQTIDGEVVTHENRRLDKVPSVGTEISISYYRGHGQVVSSLANIKVSNPFIDPKTQDLGVVVEDNKGQEQIVLFNSVANIERFASAHGFGKALVEKAMDLREASPKATQEVVIRDAVTTPYLDSESGCLAIDYKERGATYTALFRNAQEMAVLAGEYGLGARAVSAAQELESGIAVQPSISPQESMDVVRQAAMQLGYVSESESKSEGRTYEGKIIAVSTLHVAQDLGRKQFVIHEKTALDKLVQPGADVSVKYRDGRGAVTPKIQATGISRS